MKKIPLTQGKFAIVDDEDYLYLMRFNWYVSEFNGHYYVARRILIPNMKKGRTYEIDMKFFIVPSLGGNIIIHKNKNNFDFRKENLVYATTATLRNRARKSKYKSSGYKGVWLNKKCPNFPWCANIEKTRDGKVVRYRKQHKTEKEAALDYNRMALEWFGEYSYQNKV